MDASQALERLTALSGEIRSAALLGPGGEVLATAGAEGASLAAAGPRLLAAAGADVASVEVGDGRGTVFAVRGGDTVACAVTGPEPLSALVFHDLRACLAQLGEPAGVTGA